MNGQGRQTSSFGDELTNAAMIGLVVLFGVALVLRGAGSVAAWITGTSQPSGGPASGIGVLFYPGDPASALGAPGLSPVVYWIVAGLLLAALVAGAVWVWSGCAGTRTGSSRTPVGWRASPPARRSLLLRPRRRCCAERKPSARTERP